MSDSSKGSVYSNASSDVGPVASVSKKVPMWNETFLTTFAIDSLETPVPRGRNVTGVSISESSFNRTFNRDLTINATNLNPVINVSFTERFNVTCLDGSAISNFTVRYYPSLANFSYLHNLTNVNTFRVINVNYTKIFTKNNDSGLLPLILLYQTAGYFTFNISKAVSKFENASIYTNASFIVEMNLSYPIKFSGYTFTMLNPWFELEGNTTTKLLNYSQSFRLTSGKALNMSLLFSPVEGLYWNNTKFYKNSVQFTPPAYNSTFNGWRIAPGGFISSNNTVIKVDFWINTTVGFSNIKASRWATDSLIMGLDTRRREYMIEVLKGPPSYLVERIKFNVTDMALANIFQQTKSTYPTSVVTLENNTYQYFDPELEQTINMPNGTRMYLTRAQKACGRVTISFNYNGSYNATMRILDEVHNPLPDAQVELLYNGVRFGTLMGWNGSIYYPAKTTSIIGMVSFNYLPEGNYTAVVHFRGTQVQAQNFTLNGKNRALVLDVITTVPYQPTILVSWFAIFSFLAVLGVVLLKRKR